MKAPRKDQLQLLEVARLDAQINRLERDNQKHPLRENLAKLMNGTARQGEEVQATTTRLTQARKNLREAEARSADLQSQIADREAKYNAGEGLTSRDLLTLEAEMASLREALDGAAEAEFTALETVENEETALAQGQEKLQALSGKLTAEREKLETVVAEIQSQQADIRRHRDALYEPLAAPLKNLYDHAVASGGYTVMAMAPDGSTDGGLRLSPVEVAAIKNKPADEIYLAEEYDCIIVPIDTALPNPA
ncbi:Uncharacterised protein [Actinobaculum suis]|uniref:CT398-like coiled coil hairpin domain-containing protein n=1 Tax=Actinobaculum suis TaxID=1657 RepID=A0A0K9ESW7_9ACTO|nr:hypothetical protein [Actinobaculum suis]KMY22892.1 hypothetical protein ACU19_07780 [Actinobaculum suis]OCA93942.1 hypothetical protein ACU20_07365 [Actinobaculum suis]OCA94407.1 hypothetical protein ACU21_06750 [Actinobaculum suis]VDG76671.1 Uncharacterised protein [Actinobaculum suis]